MSVLLFGLAHPAVGRTWTSKDGRTLEAELIDYDAVAGTLRIERADGQEFTLKMEQLSADDAAYIESLQEQKKAALAAATAAAREKAGQTATHTSTGNHKVPFHVYYPESYDGSRKLPMLILFSPGGRGKGIMNKFVAAADAIGWILVGCDRFKNGMEAELGDAMFTELLPDIEQTVTHDPERLYMGGMSGGALRAYNYSAKFDRPWKGIVACGGWLGGADAADKKYAKNMAVAIVNGDNDNNANSWIEKDTAVLEGRRCKVRVFEFPGGHVVGPPETLQDAMKWIASEQE